LEVDSSEGTNVLITATRANDNKLSVLASGQGGPSMVAIWELADNSRIEDFGGRRGLEVQIKT
jgi:hypothetical protein